MTNREMARILHRERVQRGLKVRPAARRAKIDHTTVLAMERGDFPNPYVNLRKLAKSYGYRVVVALEPINRPSASRDTDGDQGGSES